MNPASYHIGEPPARLKKAHLDNIALVPASLLLSKDVTYLPVARRLPTGSVLCVSGTPRQQRIITQVTQFFRSHGHQVFTLPLDRITKRLQKPRPKAEQVSLAF